MVGEKYGVSQTAAVLVVFESEELLRRTLQRVSNDAQFHRFDGMERYLFFGLQQEVKDEWTAHWMDINGNQVDVFE